MQMSNTERIVRTKASSPAPVYVDKKTRKKRQNKRDQKRAYLYN